MFQATPRYVLSPIIVLPSPGGNFPLMNQLLIPFPIHSFISIPLPVNSLSRSWHLFHFFTLIFAYKIASFKNRLWSFFLWVLYNKIEHNNVLKSSQAGISSKPILNAGRGRSYFFKKEDEELGWRKLDLIIQQYVWAPAACWVSG